MKSILTGAIAAIALVTSVSAATMTGQTASASFSGKNVTIKYSSPAVNGRTGKLFGKDGTIGNDPNYPVWRAGANEATVLHTDANLTIGNLKVPKGDYTLYVNLTDPEHWELIVNKQTGQWGLSYDAKQDVGRVKMTMTKPASTVEQLKYTLTGGGNKGKLELSWENHTATVPIVAE
jgi:hypothetical protein